MTIDEYALFQRANGIKVVEIDGVWWAELRPFFFRPLLPFTEINPKYKRYPFKSSIGGFQHVVPPGGISNSCMNFFVFDDLQNYALAKLSHNHRDTTKKGIKNFYAKQIVDVTEFVNDAYDIYVTFYNRTKYNFKKERIKKKYFFSWAKTLFEYPKILVVGAYCHDKLSAVDISCRIEDIILDMTFFSDTESQRLKVSDFLIHIMREAASFSNAKYIFKGMPSGKPSLDDSKLMRGCKLLTLPALYKINPIVLSVARVFMKNSYNKLIGIT